MSQCAITGNFVLFTRLSPTITLPISYVSQRRIAPINPSPAAAEIIPHSERVGILSGDILLKNPQNAPDISPPGVTHSKVTLSSVLVISTPAPSKHSISSSVPPFLRQLREAYKTPGAYNMKSGFPSKFENTVISVSTPSTFCMNSKGTWDSALWCAFKNVKYTVHCPG